MDENVIDPQYSLTEMTQVNFIDGKVSYIKEYFTKDDIKDKETIEVTLLYIVLPPRMGQYTPLAYEDEKKTINVKDLHSVQKIILK